MDLVKGIRAPERLYRAVLWIVSFIFAAFIVGLGNLIIGDLPRVDEQLVSAQPAISASEARLDREIAGVAARTQTVRDRLEIARLQLDQAQRASTTGTDTFRAWIAARTATVDPKQDPEVLSRTRQLEALKAAERSIQASVAALENEEAQLNQRSSTLEVQRSQAAADALPAQERARFGQELRVFALRLAITLPMLLIAGWLVWKKRRSDYWPLARGFVIAALFVFFVELVPYLPSYGGYIRYVVGIALTIIVAVFLIRKMRTYLANRQRAEAQADIERRSRVSRDEAFRKMGAGTCPGCDRPVATTGSAEANFCVHCGLTLFDHCPRCETRKMAFFRHCMTCGLPTDPPPTVPPPTVAPTAAAPLPPLTPSP